MYKKTDSCFVLQTSLCRLYSEKKIERNRFVELFEAVQKKRLTAENVATADPADVLGVRR